MSIGLIADKDGDLLNCAAGFRDEDSLVKMEHDSIIQIASMTKLVTLSQSCNSLKKKKSPLIIRLIITFRARQSKNTEGF